MGVKTNFHSRALPCLMAMLLAVGCTEDTVPFPLPEGQARAEWDSEGDFVVAMMDTLDNPVIIALLSAEVEAVRTLAHEMSGPSHLDEQAMATLDHAIAEKANGNLSSALEDVRISYALAYSVVNGYDNSSDPLPDSHSNLVVELSAEIAAQKEILNKVRDSCVQGPDGVDFDIITQAELALVEASVTLDRDVENQLHRARDGSKGAAYDLGVEMGRAARRIETSRILTDLAYRHEAGRSCPSELELTSELRDELEAGIDGVAQNRSAYLGGTFFPLVALRASAWGWHDASTEAAYLSELYSGSVFLSLPQSDARSTWREMTGSGTIGTLFELTRIEFQFPYLDQMPPSETELMKGMIRLAGRHDKLRTAEFGGTAE